MKIHKIDFSKGKSMRVDPLDHVDQKLRESFEEIKKRDGIDACYDALIKIYGDDLKDQIDLLINNS